MADKLIEKEYEETNWFSAELRILEAEYEKSKLQVYQDTLFCKRSMVELELLCKNEQLRKNVRVNNKLKEHDSRLQEQLESLSSNLNNATSQLQTAQNTLQDEKAHHQLEKKELEEKLNSDMERKMEEHRERASKRENLLQEEIRTLQDKHVKVFKEAENLRTELSKKNVAVKTKAIQAMVNVKNASTMVQVGSQTCDAGVQVQDLSSGDDCFRKNGDGTRESDEDLQETNETGKKKKEVMVAKDKKSKEGMIKENKPKIDKRKNVKTRDMRVKAKAKPVQKCKVVNEDKEKENEMIDKKTTKKGLRKRKSQPESVTCQNETKTRAEKQHATTSTHEKSTTEVEFQERDDASNSWLSPSASPGDDIPFKYSTTPERLQKLEEGRKSLEKPANQAGVSAQDISGSSEETNRSKKGSEVSLEKLPLIAVCIEDILNKETVENEEEVKEMKEVLQDHKDGAEEFLSQNQSARNEGVSPEKQKSLMIEEDRKLLDLNEAQIQLQDEEEVLEDSEKTNACKDIQGEELAGAQDVNERMQEKCKGKKDSKRKPKSRQIKSVAEHIPQDKGNSVDETNDSQAKRVLRSRTKKRNSGVEQDTNNGEERKSLGKEARQKPRDSDVETGATRKHETVVGYLQGRELAMLDKSSHEADQFPRETDMSSREIDRFVDEPRPSRGVTSREPAGDETSKQQTEPEVLGELNEEAKTAQGERRKDYKSDQGSLALNDNRIRKEDDAIFHGCLHKALEEEKSTCQNGPDPLEKNVKNKVDLSAKNKNITREAQLFQDVNDVSASKKQDSDTNEADYNKHLSREVAKSASRDTGRAKRDGQDPAGVSALPAASSKENASDGKLKGRRKRKPTSSVREVLAPADQQSNSDCGTSAENPSMLDCTKKRKTLFNSRENSLMVPVSDVQMSFANATLSKGRANAGIPPSLSAFMRSFIAPKLKKSH